MKPAAFSSQRRQSAHKSHRSSRRRLFLETLESRQLMAVVSYWTADNTALDSVGTNHGTLVNGTAFAAGQVGQAFSFDGVNDRVQIADLPSFQLTQSLSLEGWIKVNSLPATIEAMIFFRGDSRGGLDPYVLMLNPSGQLQFRISSETASAIIQAPVSTGQFIHVAATLDDSTGLMSLYQNGVLAAQVTTAIRPFAALDPTQNPAVGIGNANSTYNAVFNGLIDDLKLYDHALTASDVLANFNARKGSLQPSLTLSISDVSLTEGSSHFNVSMPDLVSEATSGGLFRSTGMTYGPDGNLYVGNFVGSGEILKYSPSGTFLGAFVSNVNNGGLTTPAVDGVIFRPDGKLYVASRDNANVLRFDATTGAYIDEFIVAGSGGLSQIKGMEFGADGNIYLSSAATSQVLRFSRSSGAYLGQFVGAGSGGLANPRSLTFGPDGNLYVSSSNSNSVLRYHGTTGVFIDAFIPSKRGGLLNPGELLFNNGNLYVASQNSNQVLRFDGTTGAFMDAVDPSNSVTMDRPIGLLVASDGNLLVGSYGKIHRLGASTNAVFAVNVASYWPTTVTVDYQTANVSAQSGSDYQALSGSLTFLPGGPRTQTIVIPTMDDLNIEAAETFAVTLSNASGAQIQDSQGIGTILDNDTKFYVVDDSTLNRNFEYADNGAAGENYNLTTANTAPRGAASTVAGDKVWVVDANRNVYVYNAHGTLVGSWTAGSLNGSSVVEGITVHGNDVWIVDAKSDKVYRYDGAASRLAGSQNASGNFSLNSANKDPGDLVTDGSSIWVLNNTSSTDKVFKYTIGGTLDRSWSIAGGGGSPTGITLDPSGGTDMWIVDNTSDKVYLLSGARNAANNSSVLATQAFSVAAGNPQGIADPPPNGSLVDSAMSDFGTDRSVPVAFMAVLPTLISSPASNRESTFGKQMDATNELKRNAWLDDFAPELARRVLSQPDGQPIGFDHALASSGSVRIRSDIYDRDESMALFDELLTQLAISTRELP